MSVGEEPVMPMYNQINIQGHLTQNLPLATTCRFKSGFRHHRNYKASRLFAGPFFVPGYFCQRVDNIKGYAKLWP